MVNYFNKNKTWISFVILTLLLILVFSFNARITDSFYGDIIYPFVRRILNIIIAPFSFSIALFFIGYMLFILVKSIIEKGALQIVRFSLLMFAFFYWMWGFNYYRSPLNQSLALNFEEVDDSTHYAFSQAIMDSCVALSSIIGDDSSHDYMESLMSSSEIIYERYSFLKAKPTAPVSFKPDAFLLRLGIMGMYFPYTGQAQFDSDLTLIDRPFTMAHEWSHAAGIAPEYEADFFAYLICIEADDPRIRYSAYMTLIKELLFHYKYTDSERHELLKLKINSTMKKHIEDRRKLFKKHGSVMYAVSDEMIERYLKMHGQQGLSDYHRLSEYVFAFNKNLHE